MRRLRTRSAAPLLALLLPLALPLPAHAQGGPAPLPQGHVPGPVLLQLRTLESQFEAALGADCAPERCFPKGCYYVGHAAVDTPRASSLPGLTAEGEGPGSVPVQEYLTDARCEFTHEKAVPARDVQALVRRLEQRLSKGWLKVGVSRQALEPVPPSLREPAAPEAPAASPLPAPPAEAATPPAPFTLAVAVRELWLSLLPHFFWMVALVLGTLAALTLIWAQRRLGRASLEEQALAAQLASGAPAPAPAAAGAAAEAPAEAAGTAEGAAERAFADAQRQLWGERIGRAELSQAGNGVAELLRGWLQAGEFDLLAKAIFVFGERLSQAFASDGQLAQRKVEFAEHLKRVDEKALPSDAEFFRTLNHHALSSSLLSHEDAEVYRSLREEFGSLGVTRLVESLSPRHGALLFALVPTDCQHEVARTMSPVLRLQVADELLLSNRMSRQETEHLFRVLDAARAGRPLPPAPAAQGLADRGREFDAAGALSVLLPRIDAEERAALFTRVRERTGGAFPQWYQGILYGDMLLKLPEELRKDLLLEVDVRGLAGWSSLQQPAWRESFIARLAPAMQNAVRASMAFGSREDQLHHARRGHDELVSALKRQVARGTLDFPELVA
jgi:hypothetical protein